jgi:HAD superfamily hydrolase (TIGR01544 family)
MNIIIPNQQNCDRLKDEMKNDGRGKLHILSDFDRTLTYGSLNGVKTPSIISLLRDGKHLSEDYAEKANALFDKYHAVEVDQSIPLEKRKAAMQEWWETHNKLLIESGLSFSDLEDIVENGHLEFREGVLEFLDFLHEQNIPLVILSASGCGDAIQLFFRKFGKDYPNVIYVTNKFNWDKNGKAVSTKEPIVHSLNKDETILLDVPEVREKIENRKNVILLGDSISDLGMIEGFDYKSLLKIGFLNSDYNESIDGYKENFDVIIEGDGDFSYVNNLVFNL